jgi:hypothetical protein
MSEVLILHNNTGLLLHPLFKPDLAPSDYHLSDPLKEKEKSLQGHHFAHDEALQNTVH